MKLLATGNNAKTILSDAMGEYLTGILYLAPADLSGYQVCPHAKLAGCAEACLNTAGRGAFNNVQAARIRKTRMFFEAREAFMLQLEKDIIALERKAEKLGVKPAVRLNGTSDIRFERVPFGEYANIMERFPNVQFYDYTKNNTRSNLPANYNLTWSYSNASERYAAGMHKARDNGHNVAVVFRKESLPASFCGIEVIDGTTHDLRFTDKAGVIVGLCAKGKAKRDQSGFVVDVA